MNGLDLFSGIGGISLALKPWVRTVAYCERDRYAQGVLLSRMRDGLLERAPIWDDVSTLRAELFGVPIDVISGGFPCQDLSVAGAGAGLEGSRSGLFFHIVRLARELRPSFIFLENVPAIAVRGLDRVLLEFTALGYDCRWTVVSAAEVGAPHLRERWWLLAHASGARLERLEQHENPWAPLRLSSRLVFPEIRESDIAESRREGHGLPRPVGAVRCLGNSVVPQAAREAFAWLLTGKRGV